jgi:hypothetical protein
MTPVEYLIQEIHRLRLEDQSQNLSEMEIFKESQKLAQEAMEKEKVLFKRFYLEGVMSGRASIKTGYELDFEESFNELYKRFTI